ncbi:uncharacterized protein LOC141619870 [Silene latifolia]|uniref:uncharacterized protein LOC141619870 n=1 Tax=Silene latifolia TaxID=37657 RepID=UPI003D787517
MVFKCWYQISSPTLAGGFNVKDLTAWNYSLICKWIWQLFLRGVTTRDHLINLAGSIQVTKLLFRGWTVNSKFSVQSAYGYFTNASTAGNWTAGLAQSSITPSHKIICSLAAQQQLATLDNLQRRDIPYTNRCVLCLTHGENHAHLFFICSVSSAIWQQLLTWMGISGVISSLQEELFSIGTSRYWRTAWMGTTRAATVHQLWVE